MYYFFSVEGLANTCASFEKIQVGFNRGPASTMAYLLVTFSSIVFSFNNKTLYTVNEYIFSWVFFWIKYLDFFIARYDGARLLYSGSYFMGRKGELNVTVQPGV